MIFIHRLDGLAGGFWAERSYKEEVDRENYSALCKAFHKADYAKCRIMESSVRACGRVVGGERFVSD